MIKATLTHQNTHTETEEIELPDIVNTGDIIRAIAEAMRNFDYADCMDADIFEIALEDGRVFHCYPFANIFNKWRLYVEEPGFDDYEWLADFKM